MPDHMALRPTTIRFSADAMALVQEAAEGVGSTLSQFVREAAIMRAILETRGGHDFARLADQVKHLARSED